MMAQLRGTPASSAPAKLFDTDRETWVSADDVMKLRNLMDTFALTRDWKDGQRLGAFCRHARGWAGTFDELLDAWAEDRRLDATHDWQATVTREVARSQNFPPYTNAYLAGL